MIRTLRATNNLGPSARPRLSVFSGSRLSARGFSLIEIMIVIGLIALVTAVAVPTLNNVFRVSRDSFAKTLSLSLREARDRAMLMDKLIRLRIDLDKQQYWFEEAPATYLRPNPNAKGLDSRDEERIKKDDAGAFRKINELTKEKVEAPKGVKIVDVRSPRFKEPMTAGVVDLYFYSNGNSDGASIHFETDEMLRQTIHIHPITGQAKIVGGFDDEKK